MVRLGTTYPLATHRVKITLLATRNAGNTTAGNTFRILALAPAGRSERVCRGRPTVGPDLVSVPVRLRAEPAVARVFRPGRRVRATSAGTG
ncbi:MAG: hypothetical protein IPL39_13090 [Opitutaceae bacterium]|nr:hypothetical protein [Opitutaceae bacterium]